MFFYANAPLLEKEGTDTAPKTCIRRTRKKAITKYKILWPEPHNSKQSPFSFAGYGRPIANRG